MAISALREARIKVLRDDIDAQFPEKSAVKNDVLDAIAASTQTNRGETAYLAEKRFDAANWYETRQLALLDITQIINRELTSNYDRFEFIAYLIGAQAELPLAVRDRHDRDKFKSTKRLFKESPVGLRNYVLQPLINGAISEPAIQEKLMRLILGEKYQDGFVTTVFNTYLNEVPQSEKLTLLGHILASFPDNRRGKFSVKAALEAMGVFGIKAGQFLAASGLAPPEMREELREFFDRATPPVRVEIFNKLAEVFGDDLGPILKVGRLLGSGSVNYVVEVFFSDPRTSLPVRAVLRIQRDTAKGQIHNENIIWQKVLRRLTGDSDAATRKFAAVMEEVRQQNMATLGPTGMELDQRREITAYPRAQSAYRRARNRRQQFDVDVTRPLQEFNAEIPESLKAQNAVFAYVENTSWDIIQPPTLREKAALEIVSAEWDAIFVKGDFDADPHPGNWLKDMANNRLVRADYAQMSNGLNPNERLAFHRALGTLVYPQLKSSEIDALAAVFPLLFSVTDGGFKGLREVIASIVAEAQFPDYKNFPDRLFYLREKVEEWYAANGFPDFKLRLKPNSRLMMAAFLKTLDYRRHISPVSFMNELLPVLNVSRVAYAARLLNK